MRLVTYIQTHYQISRRTFTLWIKQGYVFVNNKKIESYTQEIQPGDKITIKAPNFKITDIVQQEKNPVMIVIFNKPKGYVVSRSDPYNTTIYEILPAEFKKLYYIGRLDKNSHGLLLLTNRPEMVHRYEHPKHGIEKEYNILLDKELSEGAVQDALRGVKDKNDVLKVLKITKLKKYTYRVLLNEGKKRHIRRLFQVLGYRIIDLQRVREGKYSLGNIKIGEWKVYKYVNLL